MRQYLYYAGFIAIPLLLVSATRQFFHDSGWRWIYILILSFSISFFLTPVCGWIAKQFDIIDVPDTRKSHLEATPLLGGAAVFLSFAAALLINGIFSFKIQMILGAAGVLFLTELADDIKDISASIRLIAQLICTGWVIGTGIILHIFPEAMGIAGFVGNIALTALWIIGITNAMNFFDGMDGLAAGIGILISLFLGVVAFRTNQPFVGWIAVAMMGSCAGFLPYNFRISGRAKIFLGDAGSTVIGFILACVAVYGEWAENDPLVAFISPVLIFWVLIFDMIHITAERIISGKVKTFRQWIEYVGKDHLHHRMAEALNGQKKSVLYIYMMTFCLGTSAVALRNADTLEAIFLLFQAACIVILITILERRGRRPC